MLANMDADAVTTFEVAPDGRRFSISFSNSSGEAGSISLPTECLKQLVMTMPSIAAEALRKQYGDGKMRLVYPLCDWSLATTECDSQLILTLGTLNGFQIAFAIAARDAARITATIGDHMEDLVDPPGRFN